MSGSQPSKRRRIAGESKPDVSTEPIAPAPAAPRLPKLRRPGSASVSSDESTSVTLEKQDTPPPAAAPKPKLPVSTIALIALTVVSVAFGVFGAVWGVQKWTGDDPAATRKAASDAAATSATTILSYQYNQMPQALAASTATMTPAFAVKFKKIWPALSALAPQRKIQVKAVVRDAATLECGDTCRDDKATVLLFVDLARVADDLDKPTVFPRRVKMYMVEREGKWLVNDVKWL